MNTFIPRPDQVDFTNARWAPVINCVVAHNDKILLVKRSPDMHFYPNEWNGIGGFLDDRKSIQEKAAEELSEELGLEPDQIVSVELGQIFHADEPAYKKTWIIHPVLVVVKSNKVTLDWEAQEYRWLRIDEVDQFDLVPSFRKVIERVRHFLKN